MEGFEDWEREDVGEAAKSKRRKVERRTSLLPGELHGGQHQLLHIYRAVILRGLTKNKKRPWVQLTDCFLPKPSLRHRGCWRG